MFLLGYAASGLPKSVPVWMLLLCIYAPVIPVALAARFCYKVERPFRSMPVSKESVKSFDESLMSSCEVMVKIGGYIMLFSILAFYITKLPILCPEYKAILLGFVEITTGIQAVSHVFSGTMGGLWISGATAFGGLSGVFQTKSVIKNAGLSIRHYVVWKAIHTLLTILLFILLTRFPILLPSA
jgi:hypothetical protein